MSSRRRRGLVLLALAVHQRRQIARLNVRLSEASRVDPLTGLLNRRAFEELLNAELERSRRTGRPVSVIVGEMDGMGRVNTESGHGAGDVALQQVADDMQKWKRRIDSAGRLAGEKFGILLPETDEHGAFLVAERLRRAARPASRRTGLPLTISFGVASFPEHGEQFGVLMGAASRAVLAARELGRDRSVVYCPDVARMLDELLQPGSAARAPSIIGLAEELDVRDTGAPGHCHAVGRYAELIARELDLDPERVERLRVAGILHDVGKTGVSDRVMTKPGRSTRTSGTRSAPTPRSARGCWPIRSSRTCAAGSWPTTSVRTARATPRPGRRLHPARGAHPRGRGRLRGDDGQAVLPLGARRGGRPGELQAAAGTQFDATIVEAFLAILVGRKPRSRPRVS